MKRLMLASLLMLVVLTALAQERIADVVKTSMPAVVRIAIPRPGGGKDMVGTGFIVDANGTIATCQHVVGTNREVSVQLHNGRRLKGDVVFSNEDLDLACVRIMTMEKLSALRVVDHKGLQLGDQVIAIGHPYDYQNSVASGIVSAMGRNIKLPNGVTLKDMLQATTPINPGNSGGPLLNMKGEVVGMAESFRANAQNISFFVSGRTIRGFLEAAKK